MKGIKYSNFKQGFIMTNNNYQAVTVCGKEFSRTDIITIKEIISNNPNDTRTALSRKVCDYLNWYMPNGQYKDMSCRVAMQRLEKMGQINLPQPTQSSGNGNKIPQITKTSDPSAPVIKSAGILKRIDLLQVKTRKLSKIWNEHIYRYHYLGYKPLAGAQIRYLVYSGEALLGAFGFSASAYRLAARDQWIGWTEDERKCNLHLIVGNSRFLILPWIKSKNLASMILSKAARRLPLDWRERYAYTPVLIETFVDSDRFRGTSYKAANWKYLGKTQGRGRNDRYHHNYLSLKDIFVYPLCSDFREKLCSEKAEGGRR